jgi:hypothetical protein
MFWSTFSFTFLNQHTIPWNAPLKFMFMLIMSLLVPCILMAQGPPPPPPQNCPVCNATSLHCTGVFEVGASHVPMLYMTDGSFAWVAVKYTSDPSVVVTENNWASLNKNFYVSHSILRSVVSVSSDILMVESSSSVHANMSTAAAFSKVRDNILGGCSWFKDTHGGNNLNGWMSPYASGAQIPDAKLGSDIHGFCDHYRCCNQNQCSALDPPCSSYDCSYQIFDSCNNVNGSHAHLNSHWRLRSGFYQAGARHSIWLRIPLTLRLSASLPPLSVPVSQGLIGMYSADSWRPAELPTKASWMDLSGFGNHVNEIGGSTNISVARPVGAPAYIYGATTAWMVFPDGVLPHNYTLFYVARYNSAEPHKRTRIFQGFDVNAVLGFYWRSSMMLYHQNCTPSYLVQDLDPPKHSINLDWYKVSVRSESLRFSGRDVTQNRNNACRQTARLSINSGAKTASGGKADTSDFAVQYVLVFNQKLLDADVLRVEAWLTSLEPAFTPANLQARVNTHFHNLFDQPH